MVGSGRMASSSERPPRRPTSPDGIIVVDKPQGITSHDVVARLRRLCGTRAVGHGGTLDPMATGVLICGIGKGTKLLTYVSGADKAYSAVIRLGISTTTDDAEGEIVTASGAQLVTPSFRAESQDLVTLDRISAEMEKLTGEINQVPTSVSAIKVNGKRAYNLVREGEQVELKARPVVVSKFEIVYIVNNEELNEVAGLPVVDLFVDVVVSSGTYVRALARDLGAALGTGGHLTMLRRTRIGRVDLAMAKTLDQLTQEATEDRPLPTMPLGEAVKFFLPSREVTEQEAKDLSLGKFIEKRDTEQVTAALTEDNRLVAIIEPQSAAKAKPKVVFPWEP